MMPTRFDKMRFALLHEQLQHLYLTAAKVTLLTAAIATFLPLVLRAGLRQLSRSKAALTCDMFLP